MRPVLKAVRWAALGALLTCTVATAQSVPPGWFVHYRPGGELFVPHPRGWQVQEQENGSFLVFLAGDDGVAQALVYVKPQLLHPGRNITDVLGLLPREEAALFPGARISVREADVRTGAVIGELRFSVKGQPYRGTALVISSRGDHGTLFVISAAEGAWSAQRQTMAGILRGFAYMPPAGATNARPQPALPAMQPWRDPNEGAFTVPVPQGWQVQGGLMRLGLTYAPEILVASPDNTLQLRLGDPSLPVFAIPYDVPGIGAMPEGTTAAGGAVFLRYLPGHLFLTQFYLPRKFGALSGIQVRELPELAAQLYSVSPPAPPMQARVDAGAASFAIQLPIGPRRAYYLAATRLQTVPGLNSAGSWEVSSIVGYLSTAERELQAQALLAAMYRGFAWNVNWLASELRAQGAMVQQVIEHNRQMNEIQARTFENLAQGGERAAQARSLSARGEIKAQDSSGQILVIPQTGFQDYYRARQTGEVFASDRTDLPQFDYDRMWRMP